jgi:hypothetical protein
MVKKLDIVLHSDYPPPTCIAKLTEQIDLDVPTVFSLSGTRGVSQFLGDSKAMKFGYTSGGTGATALALYCSDE